MKKRGVVRPKTHDRPGHRSQTAATADLRAPAAEDFDWDLITEGEEWSPYEKEMYRRSHVIEPNVGDGDHCAVCCRSKGEPHADECYSGGVV